VRLPLPCPPQLIELAGYTGAGRLVALWWSPCGDELMISDGAVTETGRWRGWVCFCEHPLVGLFLEPYRLGDADAEGEHRLLVDRYLGTLEVGLARDVEQLLATQPSELSALTAHLSAAETEALLQRLLDVQSERERAKGPHQLHAQARAVWQREQELLEELTALLDDAQTAVCEALPPPAGADAGQRRLRGAAAEHEALGERVGRETVRSVDPGAGALADRVEAGQRGAPVQVADDAADQVVGGRSDRNGLALGDQACVVAGGEHVGEAARVDRAQIELHVVRSVHVHAIEDRRGERVAWGELVGEPSPASVEQRGAFSSQGLGEQRAVMV
jgi:hypothetical protein